MPDKLNRFASLPNFIDKTPKEVPHGFTNPNPSTVGGRFSHLPVVDTKKKRSSGFTGTWKENRFDSVSPIRSMAKEYKNLFVLPGNVSGLADKPYLEATYKSVREAAIGGSHFLNAYGAGIPEWAMKRFLGIEIGTNQQVAGKVLSGLGELGGYISGLPMKGAQAIVKASPVLSNALLIPQATKGKIIFQTIARGATTLALADGIAAITTPDKIPERMLRGATTGAIFSGVSFVPNQPLRMVMNSAYMGVPSTLREEPLEQQIFNYGLGAYFGTKGQDLNKLVEMGQEYNETLRSRTRTILNEVNMEARNIQVKPVDLSDRIRYMTNGKRAYEPLYDVKKWRSERIHNLVGELGKVKSDPKFNLREDDIRFVVDKITSRGRIVTARLKSLSNADLLNLSSYLEAGVPPPPKTPFVGKVVTKKGEAGPKFTIFEEFRAGRGKLRKLGLGDIDARQENLATDLILRSPAEQSRFLSRHIELVNNWKRTVGLKKETSQKLWRYLDGKAHSSTLNPKELRVAGEMKQYYDSLLNLQNQYRMSKGLEPIKAKKNYITHLFETMFKEAYASKNPIPDSVLMNLKYINPKDKKSPFFIERKNQRIGLKENVWDSLNSYSYAAAGVVTDTPIRRVNNLLKFIRSNANLNEKTGKYSKVDWESMEKNLRGFIDGYVGRPGSWHKEILNTTDAIQKIVPSRFRLSGSKAMDALRSFTYFSTMGFRPKLAIRNLGQHSLILSETGMGNLVKAMKTKNSPELNKLLSKSDVLSTRQAGGFVPGGERLKGFSKASMKLYQMADHKNVKDAFLAGFYEAGGNINNPSKYAIKHGDAVAAKTQFLYTAGNRSALAADFWGKSREVGRTAGMFTSWTANWLELMIDWSGASGKAKNFAQLKRYIALNAVLLATAQQAGIDVKKYTGLDSIPSIWKMVKEGRLPIMGIAGRKLSDQVIPQAIKDLEKADKDLAEYLFYTTKGYKEERDKGGY